MSVGKDGASVKTSALARWLARHVTAIASDPGAEICLREIAEITRDIEHRVDKPRVQRLCGRCPAVVTVGNGERVCNTRLVAPRDDGSVQCPACKTTHEVNALWENQRMEVDGHSFTVAELHELVMPTMRVVVAESTLRHWIATSRLLPTGYTSDGDPRFLFADVKDLAAAKPQKEPTGAAAHRRR